MKKKFEDNVASSTVKTKTEEPSLPWKIGEADLAGIQAREGDFAALSSEEAPLKTRPVFLVILVVAVFFTTLYMVAVMAGENENIKLDVSAKEKEAAELQVNINKVSAEKAALEKSSSQLEKRFGDITAQKELFAAVLESLAKKDDTVQIVEDTAVVGGESAAEGKSNYESQQ
jgi:hypothetical protein